jgi:hypothetical protein
VCAAIADPSYGFMSYEGRYQISVGLVFTWPDCGRRAPARCPLEEAGKARIQEQITWFRS